MSTAITHMQGRRLSTRGQTSSSRWADHVDTAAEHNAWYVDALDNGEEFWQTEKCDDNTNGMTAGGCIAVQDMYEHEVGKFLNRSCDLPGRAARW